jgi:Raf kinase inhibitor-like YbhB/YbcL family protein
MNLKLAGAVLSSGLAASLLAQQKPEQAALGGNVYRPVPVPVTADRTPRVPPGFTVRPFAAVAKARIFALGPDGTLYVSQRDPGQLIALKDENGDGRADTQRAVLRRPDLHGVAISGRRVYIATIRELLVADLLPNGDVGPLRLLADDLPDAGQHPNRTLALGPDGRVYLSVGSTCNACAERNPESATVVRFAADGSERAVFATGLRNTIGFGWHPGSRRMWGLDHGIDWLGDDDQKEELNEILENDRYGWPWVYADGRINPGQEPPSGYTKEEWARLSRQPALLHTAHSAPMQLAFYDGAQFPEEYRGDAFAAFHGSWNRGTPSGYEVVRIRFDAAGAPRAIEPFVTGFLVKGAAPGGGDGVIGRPVGVAVAKDGALLVGDDANGMIWRVAYGAGTAARDRSQISIALPETASSKGGLVVRSSAFGPDGPIPDRHSDYGGGDSPDLAWSGAPASAKSLVLLAEDPDAVSPKPFAHWMVANLPPSTTGLPAGLSKEGRLADHGGAVQGGTHAGSIGYYGPRPPAGDPPHHYHFQVLALDRTLTLAPGFTREALLDAVDGHVLAKGELVGTYQRRLEEK